MRFTSHSHVLELSAAGLVLAGFLVAPSALASPTYPPVVRDFVGMTCTPQCVICHRTNEGGFGTTNDFGDQLIADGAHAFSDDSVRLALKKLQQGITDGGNTPSTTKVDTDGDGVDDLTELKNGDLPATPGPDGQGLACSAVKYGCGARIAPSPPASHANLAALVAVLLWVGARLRRRKRMPH